MIKRTLRIFLIFVIALLCYTTISKATSTDRIVEYASRTVNISGNDFRLSDIDIKRIKDYLNQYPVSDEVADQIISKSDQMIELMKNEGVSDTQKLSEEKKQEALSLAQEAASLAGASLTYDSTENALVVYRDGKKIDVINKDNQKLVQTGKDNTLYIYIIIVEIIAIATIVTVNIRRSKANA